MSSDYMQNAVTDKIFHKKKTDIVQTWNLYLRVVVLNLVCIPLYFSVIEQLGAKQLVMQFLNHEDPNVRYEALIAVQKLMVHNW